MHSSEMKKLVNPEIRHILSSETSYIAPILLSKKVIGLLYVDRKPSVRELDNESFKHFVPQANQALGFITQR